MNASKNMLHNLKKAGCIVFFGFLCLMTLTTVTVLANENHNSSKKLTFAPSAKFEKIWVDYDVKEGEEDGMRIHLKFTAYGMKGLDSAIRIYFQTSDGKNLKDKNQNIYSEAGWVALFKDLKPGYDPAVYEDLTMFMPYDELDLDDGNYSLRMDVDLVYEDGTFIQHLTFESFTYDQGDDVSATVKRIWVEDNVTQGGKRGMRIHVNFEVTGLKGVDSKIVARVQRQNGNFVTSTSGYFANNDGDLEVAYAFKPGFDPAVYDNATIFLPYNEMNLPRGRHSLKLDIDLSYDSGELIQHLDYYEFVYTK